MNKLVGFILGEKRQKKPGAATPPRGEVAPPRFSPEEKEEIYATLRRTKDSRATVVLLNKMTEDALLQEEFKDVQQVVDIPAVEDTDSSVDDEADDGCDQFGTMRIIPSSPRQERAGDGAASEPEDGAMDFSTCRFIPDAECDASSTQSDPGGTFNYTPTRTSSKKSGSAIQEDRRQGLKNRPGKKPKKASVRDKKKRDKKRKGANTIDGSPGKVAKEEEAPSFLAAYRAPEEWELNILALEKGEARDGMMENGAFKRWNKKERPSMPSMLLKMDSSDPVQRDARAADRSAPQPEAGDT